MSLEFRQLAQRLAPELFQWYRSYRLRKFFRAQFGVSQRLFREAFYPNKSKPAILTGPFRGMTYLDETVWGPITPKWAGSYEIELTDIIEQNIKSGYDRILNLGCAEGYYAVGFAWRDQAPEVLAFDLDPFARKQARRLAQLNHVSDRIRIYGECTQIRLNELVKRRTLVLADIEGCEVSLLDPTGVPRLKEADLLIEVHEDHNLTAGGTVELRLARRLDDSHTIERRVSLDRGVWIDKHQALWQGKVTREQIASALDEARSAPQVWLWAKAK